jgi:putative ABC transport system substrate-binding protein
MQRRKFITLLGGAAVTWPLTTRAQQTAKLPTIGFLGSSTPSGQSQWTSAFVRRLHELGWVEGRTIAIEYRWAEGRFDRSPEFAAEFVRLKVDIIVTHSNPNIIAAKQATSTIPIVFATAGDPVGNKIVSSLARPGGNITGLSLQSPDLVGKRLAFLREALPGVRRLATLANVGYSAAVLEASEVEAAGRTLGMEVTTIEMRQGEDFAPAINALNGRADALYVSTDPFLNTNRIHINDLALNARLPTMSGVREYVEAGGLMSYGPSFSDLFRRAAEYVDKILRGTKPADIPVEQPIKFDLAINLKTATTLGLTIPPALLARADDVIE